jgi:DNA (cytosine-5)-methyltransferase 1
MLKVVELFAGVGGFRIGLEGYKGKSSTSNFKEDIEQNFKVIWSNQWEPLTQTKQSASEIYSKRWPNSNHSNKNIEEVIENTFKEIPKDFDVLVGGFPCQDYSVASTLKNSGGIEGKKGVLWWSIHDILKKVKKKPKFLILENVDRLLKSPSNRRGRDFAIMLGCLRDLGYVVEWRVINAADYGFAQRRRRVFIIAYHNQNKKIIKEIKKNKGLDWVNNNGALAQSFKIKPNKYVKPFILDKDVGNISDNFGKTDKNSLFLNSGILIDSRVYSFKSEPISIKPKTLESIFNFDEVDEEFYIDEKDLEKWKKLKGPNSVKREKDGFVYNYSMGGIGFDKLNKPSRTIITGEGGKSPSRFKHIVQLADGRHRRLTPVELERLNGFPDNWTKLKGITNTKRAFFMGNALVCGVVESIGITLFNIFKEYE